MADVGNGATLTLSAYTTALVISSITPGGQSIEPLDVSHLGSTGDKEYIPGELKETPEGSAEVLFNSGKGLPPVGSTHTITVTFPVHPGETTTAKTLAGTGFITAIEYPELVSDTVQRATISWKFDGGTGPTYTA